MIKVLMVNTVEYNSNEWLFSIGRATGAYISTEYVNRSNMLFLEPTGSQDIEWVDVVITGENTYEYQPVGADAPIVTEGILFLDDPNTGNKICYMRKDLFDAQQAIWSSTGILDQTHYDALLATEYQNAWPNHDSALAALLYGETLTKSETLTNAQRFTTYNEALAILGLEVDYTYDPPRGPINEAVHQYAIGIRDFV